MPITICNIKVLDLLILHQPLKLLLQFNGLAYLERMLYRLLKIYIVISSWVVPKSEYFYMYRICLYYLGPILISKMLLYLLQSDQFQ